MGKRNFEAGQWKSRDKGADRDYQTQYDLVRRSDQTAADIGLFVLKTAIVINSGALVALLTIVPKSTEKGLKPLLVAIPDAGEIILYGLLSSVIAGVFAYMYQMQVSDNLTDHWQASKPGEPSKIPAQKNSLRGLWVVTVGFCVLGYLGFAIGAWKIVTSLS